MKWFDLQTAMSTSATSAKSGFSDEYKDLDMKAKNDLAFLMGAYTRLNEANETTNSNLTSL